MSSEKTEQPTAKRLRDARQRGQVAYSRDVTSAAILVALFAYIGLTFDYSLRELEGLIDFLARLNAPEFRDVVNAALWATLLVLVKLSFPPVLVACTVGVAAGYFQVGFLLAFEALKPDMKKLNPVEGAKKIFSKKNLMEFAKNVVKVTFISVLLYKVIRGSIPDLVTFTYGNTDLILPALGVLTKRVAVYTAFAFIVIAVVDGFFQHRSHIKQLMMSIDEVKQEYKEMEGSPEVKSHRRQLQRELMAGDAAAKTKSATALVTNPTHYAVALYYEKGETKLPVVTAKGEGYLAQCMRQAAMEAEVPVVENVYLARTLYQDVKEDDYIPAELIEPVAEVLRWARAMKEERDSTG